ncbi:MAG: hypothetical protein AAF665_07355 [Pseudomonadota bacterium]
MRLLLAVALAFPTTVLAAGGDNDPPPRPVGSCKGAQVFDADEGKCVDPKNSSLDRDEIYLAVRQLAYAGRLRDAQGVMGALEENDPGRLTYMGFTHRKLGNRTLARAFYRRALDQDPDNLLARSYMGQGYVAEGNIDLALDQLLEIRSRGGADTWPEVALRDAIATGVTYNY